MYKNLSIVITCYNKEEWLDECISSIERNTVQPREIVVVHDGCESIVHKDGLTSIHLHGNFGVSHARNEGARYSKGELLLFIDGDDVLNPDYLQKMVEGMEDADIVYPEVYFWGSPYRLSRPPEEITKEWFEAERFPVVSSMMKRKVFETLGGFKELPIYEDLDFWVRAMNEGFIFKKANTLLWYRQNNSSRNNYDYTRKKEVLREILK